MLISSRLTGLTSGVFAELAALKAELLATGADVIDMSVGSPDGAPDPSVLAAYVSCGSRGDMHGYPLRDTDELQDSVCAWYRRLFGVSVQPRVQVQSLMGSQEGLAHVALALCAPGDAVLVPDPGYPIYSAGPTIAGARLVRVPMRRENGYAMDLDAVSSQDRRDARLIIASYPSNPTCAVAPKGFYERLVAFCAQNDIIALHDNAYCSLAFDGDVRTSFLQTPGALDVGVEFTSCSKTYNMAGFRIGFCAGNAQVVGAITALKNQLDYGVHLPVQAAAVAALALPWDSGQVAQTRAAYRRRGDLLIRAFMQAGWPIDRPAGSMFVWTRVPGGEDDVAFARRLAQRAALLVTPGSSFGPGGRGFVRMSLGIDDDRIAQAAQRLREVI